MTVRTLHIGKFFPPHHGGMEVFLADLVAAQQRSGMSVAVLVHGDPQADDPAWLTRVPVQVQLVYAPLALGFRAALARAIERFRPDVLHLHMPNTSVFWCLTLGAAADVPWVVHWHSDVVVSRISRKLSLLYRFYRPFEQAVLDRAERIIATSPPYLRASQPLAAWREKCAVVPLGLDLDRAPPQTAPAQPLPWREGHERRFRLLSIGRLTYYKGFETLVQVLAGLPDVELLIIGGGDAQPALEAQIRATTPAGSEPAVRLLGPVDDAAKQALLQSCDAFCMASRERTEAFGMVLLEAMAMAKPCIVSDLAGSGMPWVVESSHAGLRVALDDIPGWRAAIAQLQNNRALAREWGANGLQALQGRFSITACAQAVASEYAKVMPGLRAEAVTKDVLIVIPAKDEAATLGDLLQRLMAAGWTDVLVVDDQSLDGTGDVAAASGARVLRPVLALGAWGAMQAGIRYGLQRGYQAVVTMDADGQHEVSELPALMAARQHADVVIGAFPERASAVRRWAWALFRRLAGFELQDLTSGFRCYNRKAMAVLASSEATLLDYQDVGTLLMLRKANLHTVEVAVSMNLRSVGKSRIFRSWFSVARYMATTTLLCLSRWAVPRQRLD